MEGKNQQLRMRQWNRTDAEGEEDNAARKASPAVWAKGITEFSMLTMTQTSVHWQHWELSGCRGSRLSVSIREERVRNSLTRHSTVIHRVSLCLCRERHNFYAVHLVCAGIANTSHKHHNVFSFLLLVISEWKIVILSFLFVTLFLWFGLVWLFCLFVFEADRRKVLH